MHEVHPSVLRLCQMLPVKLQEFPHDTMLLTEEVLF